MSLVGWRVRAAFVFAFEERWPGIAALLGVPVDSNALLGWGLVCGLGTQVKYICCDKCDDWYHPRCVGMTEDEADACGAWMCQSCQVQGG